MDVKKKFLLLLFIGNMAMIQAQENRVPTPPSDMMIQKTHTFALPELLVDSIFIANLDTLLFNRDECGIDRCSKWKHFHITFEKIDSLNYSICLSLWDIPARKSTGFFKHNDFYYWMGGEILPNIILERQSKKRFSYKEPIPSPYDPPFWTLIYNTKTGNIEIKKKPCSLERNCL